MYNEGISKVGDILDLAVTYGIIEKRGAYFRYGDTLLGQGREQAKSFLAENIEMRTDLDQLIRQDAGLPLLPTSEDFEAATV